MFFALIIAAILAEATAAQDPPQRQRLTSATEFDYPPFCIVHEDGRVDGFSVELFRAALQAMDWDVTFQTGTWAEVRGLLERGEIDALPLVGRTPEREVLFDFTFPYMSLHGAIVVRDDTHGIQTLEDLRGRRIAVMAGDNAEEFLRRNGFSTEIHTTSSFENALHELAGGQHDAVVIQRLVALRLIHETGLTNLIVARQPIETFRQDFCFAVREGDRETLALLNEGLALVMADGTYRHLHAKWFAALQLPSDRPIVVGGDHRYPPFEFLNDRGAPAGYSVDLTRAIAAEMGLNVEFRLGPWDQIIQGLRDGEIDILQGMFYLPSRDLEFDFSQPHASNSYVGVIRRGEGEPPVSLGDLAGKSILLQRGDAIHDYLIEMGAGDRIALADSQEDVLRRLAEGEADCALVVRISARTLIEANPWRNLVLGRKPFHTMDYCYATLNDRHALLAQFSEGLKALEQSGEYREIYNKWLGVHEDRPPALLTALRYSALVLLPLVLILLTVLLWSWTLRRQVAQRTEAFRRSEERFRSLVEGAPDAIFVQTEMRFAYINAAGVRLFGADSAEDLQGRSVLERFDPAMEALARERIHTLNVLRQAAPPMEQVWLRLDGSGVPVEVSGVPIVFDGKDGALVFVRDMTDRKRAEAALAESERRLLTLMGNLPGMAYRCRNNERWTMLFVSDGAFELTGYRPEELLGETGAPYGDLIHPEDCPMVGEAVREAIAESRPFVLEYRIRDRSGKEKWVWEQGVAVEIPETGASVLEGFITDITVRKQVESALRESEARYRQLSETALEIIILHDLEGRILYANRAAQTFLDLPESAIRNRSVLEFVPEEYHAALRERQLQRRDGRGESLLYPIEVRKPNGERVFVEVSSALIVQTGRPDQVLIVARDISDRLRAEEELRAAKNLLERTFSSLSEAVFVIHPSKRTIVQCNAAVERIFGYAPDELIGQSTEMLYTDRPSYELFGRLSEVALDRGEVFETEFEMKRKDGAIIQTANTVSTMSEEMGWWGGVVSVVRDITDRKRADEERRNLEQQLLQAQKMESIGRLAGGVAHDFNNMLGVIMGNADLAMQGLDPQDETYGDLREILKAARRSADLTRQLLAFARRQTIAPRVLDLNDTVAGMLKMLQRLIGEDIDLLWKPGSELEPIRMDPAQLDQILANLVVNARDAITGNGKITIETGRAVFDEAYCRTRAGFLPGHYILLAVSDDGCGMDKTTLASIFEPFYTTKPHGEGTGLGLATVYGIIKQNNGFVNVYSEPNQGTTFRIYLPRHSGKGEFVDFTQDSPDLRFGTETVLLVEDEESLLLLATRLLSSLGYTVLTAGSPGEALRIAREHPDPIHLLMTDVVMPEMSGRDLWQAISALRTDLKCLYVSGYTSNVIAHHGVLDAGVHFLQKPFTTEALAAALREALED